MARPRSSAGKPTDVVFLTLFVHDASYDQWLTAARLTHSGLTAETSTTAARAVAPWVRSALAGFFAMPAARRRAFLKRLIIPAAIRPRDGHKVALRVSPALRSALDDLRQEFAGSEPPPPVGVWLEGLLNALAAGALAERL